MQDVPNMPESLNGATNGFESSHRTFTRPYSAKNIVFYKAGDEHFQGIRVPVSKAKYRTMDSLMDDLNERIPLSFGVRRVFTPHGRTEVTRFDQLQNDGKYVCTSSKWARKLNMSAVERMHRMRKEAEERNRSHKRAKSHNDTIFASSAAALKQKERFKALTSTQTPPIPQRPKQILFVLNGSQNQVYRTLIRVQRLPLFEELLTEVSQGFQRPIHKLFTMEGKKIGTVEEILNGPMRMLACQRHERPQLHNTNNHKFPPIPRTTNRFINNNSAPPALKENSANKRKNVETKETTVASLPPLPPNAKQRKPTGQENKIQKNQRRQSPAKRSKTMKHREQTPRLKPEQVEAITKIQAGVRGYITRKQLSNEHNAAAKIQAGARGFLTRKKADNIGALNVGEVHTSATRIQAHYRGHKARINFLKIRAARRKIDSMDMREAEQASVRIQAAYRGYKVRKDLWHPPPLQHVEECAVDMHFSYTSTKVPEATSTDLEKQEQAAVLIQAAFRGHSVRDQLKNPLQPSVHTKIEKKTKRKKIETKTSGKVTYAVSIFTGNRWGADFDGDMFIQIFGDKGESDKVWLKQHHLDQKFLQNQVDTFDVEIPHLGTLQKITVGHELHGYGAGTFLERVIISDTIVDMKQFVFICSKWLDSSQVDRKLIRTMERAGVYNLTSMPDALAELQELGEANALSKGRWSLKVHTASKPNAGTTSDIFIIGFGSFGRSDPIPVSDPSLETAGTTAQFEVNFGSIGDLYKLRFYSEENGTDPSWMLDYVELKDLDTGEEFVLYCGKWLGKDPNGNKNKGSVQKFRELPVVRVGIEPLSVVQYSIKVHTTNIVGIDADTPISVNLMGEYGDSGTIYLSLPPTNGDTQPNGLDFKLEAVSIGRLWSVNVEFKLDTKGEVVSEGFIALQDMYEKQNMSISSGGEWGIEKVFVRESAHAPYQFVFGDSRIMPSETSGTVRKQILLTEMEGLSTKAKDKKGSKTPEGVWEVWVTSGDHSESVADGIPYITVYGDLGVTEPLPLRDPKQTLKAGQTTAFKIEAKDVGLIFKIRLILAPETDEKGETKNASWYLKKLKMKECVAGDELRFPVEMWLDAESVIEIPAIWPDIPPLPLLLYQVTVVTSTDSGNDNDFVVFLRIHGEKGDTGRRILRNAIGTQPGSLFKPGNVDTFEIEAVTVKGIKNVEVGLERSGKSVKWLVESLRIHDPEYNKMYSFDCKSWLNSESGQMESFPVGSVEHSDGMTEI